MILPTRLPIPPPFVIPLSLCGTHTHSLNTKEIFSCGEEGGPSEGATLNWGGIKEKWLADTGVAMAKPPFLLSLNPLPIFHFRSHCGCVRTRMCVWLIELGRYIMAYEFSLLSELFCFTLREEQDVWFTRCISDAKKSRNPLKRKWF